MKQNRDNPIAPNVRDNSPDYGAGAEEGLPPDAPRRSPQAAREVRRNSALRQARTCYQHLAGVAGVELLGKLLDRGWLEPEESLDSRTNYHPTALGLQELRHRGIEAAPATNSRRRFAYGCRGWTERRLHLGGALGAMLMDALNAQGAVRRHQGTRTVFLENSIAAWLDRLDRLAQPG